MLLKREKSRHSTRFFHSGRTADVPKALGAVVNHGHVWMWLDYLLDYCIQYTSILYDAKYRGW